MKQGNYLYTNVVLASRGCPHQCSFCYNSCNNRLYVRRPVQAVVSDILALNTKHVLFVDDNFIGDPDYTRTLLKAISHLKLAWSAAVTTHILNHPDLLQLMVDTGCKSLFIGFESINEVSLAGVNKHNQVAKYERLVKTIHSMGIMVNASLVFGLDGDTLDTFKRTLEWLVKMRVGTMTAHILTPYPGTQLYRDMDKAGRILDFNLEKYNTANVVFKPLNMTARELYEGYLWMYKKFYSLKNIIRRLPNSKAQRRSYLLFNFLYRKFGRLTAFIAKFVPMRSLGKFASWISYKKQ